MFDGSIINFEQEIALDKPSAKALSYILRHPETWPENFEWDYSDCRYCAIGLSNRLWKITHLQHHSTSLSRQIGRAVGIPSEIAQSIFFHIDRARRIHSSKVTPEHVADAIDTYLAKLEQV